NDGIFILLRVLLDEILHGLDKHTLAFNVARIIILQPFAATAPASGIRKNRNSKNFGHGTTSDAQGTLRVAQNCMGGPCRNERQFELVCWRRGTGESYCVVTTLVRGVVLMRKASSEIRAFILISV